MTGAGLGAVRRFHSGILLTLLLFTAVFSLAATHSESLESWFMHIPGLYVVALWLHGSTDILIPLPLTSEELEPLHPYGQEEVMGLLREPARRRLEFFERKSLR